MTIFVDTNVFVYARDSSQPGKQPAAARWLEVLWSTRTGRTSTQVLSEYYVTVTRKLTPGLPVVEARGDVEDLGAWKPLAIDDVLVRSAWIVEDRYGFSWWDSLMVAAAEHLRCSHLLTEDLQDGQELDGLTVVDPFRHEPQKYLPGFG
jgi:predicted nucleic acid-binding protein